MLTAMTGLEGFKTARGESQEAHKRSWPNDFMAYACKNRKGLFTLTD